MGRSAVFSMDITLRSAGKVGQELSGILTLLSLSAQTEEIRQWQSPLTSLKRDGLLLSVPEAC
jgi:hypothetical protein